jgi:hypothetical protein
MKQAKLTVTIHVDQRDLDAVAFASCAGDRAQAKQTIIDYTYHSAYKFLTNARTLLLLKEEHDRFSKE